MEIPEHLKKWRLNVCKQQQTFYSLLGDREWDELNRNQKDFKNNLKTKISLALFAEPFAKCKSAQQTQINATLEAFLQLCGSGDLILIGYTYVHILTESQQESILPLIRVKSKYDSKASYFEMQPGKIYEDWDNFLESNNIPAEAYLCYPKGGCYRNAFDKGLSLQFDKSRNKASDSKVNDCPVSIFFPFYKTLHKAEIAVGMELTHILMSKSIITEDPFDGINDKNHLALWLKSIIKEIGNVGIETDTFTSMVLETNVYFVAVRLFRCIYNTSYKVNTSKFIISLMTILLKQKIGKCKADDYNDFLAGLVFLVNITAEMNFVKEIVAKLNEKPLQIENFCTPNRPYEAIKKLVPTGFNSKPMKKAKCDRNTYGVCYALKQIYNQDIELIHSISHPVVSTKIISYLKSVKSALKGNSKEFWANVNKTLHPIFTEYMNAMTKHKIYSEQLEDLWDKIGFPKKDIFGTYFNNSLPSVARKILVRLDAICKIEDWHRLVSTKVRLLTYSLELSRTVYCHKDEQLFDILAMVVEKFISWFESMTVELKSKNDKFSDSDIERIIGRIFVKLNDSAVIKQFKEDYVELYEMNQAPYLGEPAFSSSDMELYYFCERKPSILDGFEEAEEGDVPSVEFVIEAISHLMGTKELGELVRFQTFLRASYKTTVVIAHQRREGDKIYGFFVKIIF